MEEILEKREKIDESTNAEEISKFKEDNDVIIQAYIKDIAEAIEKKQYEEALGLVKKFQYFNRIDEAIETWNERHSSQ